MVLLRQKHIVIKLSWRSHTFNRKSYVKHKITIITISESVTRGVLYTDFRMGKFIMSVYVFIR